jgi:hypothetical protein
MKLQCQPNIWSCLPSAFAMVLDRKVQAIVDQIGHDGSEIIFPNLKDPQARRSFHIQEVLIACLKLGFRFMAVHRQLVITPDRLQKFSWLEPAYDEFLSTHIGVLTGVSSSGKRHSVAWDGHEIYDPSGIKYNIQAFHAETFWPLLD